MPKTLRLRSYVSNHARSLVMLGLSLSLLTLIVLYNLTMGVSIIAALIIMLAYLALRLGVAKLNHPRYAIVLCHDHMQFHHRYGGWSLNWENLQRVGIPHVDKGMTRFELDYIGVRLRDNERLLNNINPRLIAHLLTEQRAALLSALRQDCQSCSSTPAHHRLIENDYYTDKNGKIYTGLTAMFAHRMNAMRELTGFDLLIDQALLDRKADDFIQLLRDYQARALRESTQ